MKCYNCERYCIKSGFQKKKQRYYCKRCHKYQVGVYTNKAYEPAIDEQIKILVKESAGIRSISRILKISPTTTLKRIIRIADAITRPSVIKHRASYEMDELWTYVKSKKSPVWITYAMERKNKTIIDFRTGTRTAEKLSGIVNQLLEKQARKIYTDRLNVYPGIIPKIIHKAGRSHTRKIERLNLNLRTHLKRLSRKTICYSKSSQMLEACLRIYFWG